MGYSPQGPTELDTTEHTHMAYLVFMNLYFLSHHVACRIPRPGIKPMLPAVETVSYPLDHQGISLVKED